nr:hypothetical protein CFP56_31799 [Quercus suber]
MAMPHPGVLQAAVDPLNADIIMQPDELDGLGNYHIRASVPSPVVHVLCVTVNQSVLQPFVYELWENSTDHDNVTALNMTSWPSQLAYNDPFLGHTVLHDVFGWGLNSSSIGKNWPPVFPKLPHDYNTILNDTNSDLVYGRDSIYILGKGGEVDAYGNPNDENYALCQLKSSLTPYCSTQYNVSQAGGTLEAICEDPHDDLQYIRSMPTALSGNASISRDWPEVAVQWALSKCARCDDTISVLTNTNLSGLSFNDGTVEANSSNARLLTQLILTQSWAGAKLNPALPSMAEALAVMSGCTLISSAQDSPFVEFWNYTVPAMSEGQHQSFRASLRAQQYASGGTADYQKALFIPLFIVFFLSLFILLYFLAHREWYTDFAEPSTLFSLAVNSPPSRDSTASRAAAAATTAPGPHGKDFRVSWKLYPADDRHVFIESLDDENDDAAGDIATLRKRVSTGFERLRVSSGFTGSPKSFSSEMKKTKRKKRNSNSSSVAGGGGGGDGGNGHSVSDHHHHPPGPVFEMLETREP